MIGRKAAGSSFLAIAFVSLLALVFAPVVYASGDPFIAPSPGPGIMVIEGKWQFHLGDDLSWSKAAFDDSAWEQLNADRYWGAQTHPGYTGFAWYRKQIHLTGRPGKVAVLIPPVQDAYELFWNGQKIGEFGKLPPHGWRWATPRGVVYPLGTAPLDGVLALRVWKSPPAFDRRERDRRLLDPPLIGLPAALTQRELFTPDTPRRSSCFRVLSSPARSSLPVSSPKLLFLRECRDFFISGSLCFSSPARYPATRQPPGRRRRTGKRWYRRTRN